MSQKKSNIPIVATLEHSGAVRSVAFHPTANLMATGSEDGTVKLWDTNTQECVATLSGHRLAVKSIAFHPTADILMSGSMDTDVKLWDTNTHMCLSTKNVHRYWVSCVAFHPSKPFIVTSGKMDFPKLWQLSPDYTRLTLMNDNWCSNGDCHPSVNCVAFHPSEPFIVTAGSNSKATLWLLLPDNQVSWLGDMNCSRGEVNSVAFHPTLPILVTGDSQNVKLWQIIYNRRSMVSLGSNPRNIDMMGWYSVRRIDCIDILEGHQKAVSSVAFHPTAPVLVSCSADESVKMWKLPDNREPVQCMGTLFGQRGPVTCLALHPNGRVFATGNERNAALLWDCSVLNSRRQRNMAVMRNGMTMKLQDNFFGMYARTPHIQEGLDYKSNQRGPNLLTPQERAASLIARRINSRRYRPAIVAPAPVRTISPIAPPPRDRSLSYTRARRGRSASPPRGIPLSYTRSRRRGRSASPSYTTRLGGSSIIHRIKKHSSRKIKRRMSKTKRYRK
jgi:WD40 repeat protein